MRRLLLTTVLAFTCGTAFAQTAIENLLPTEGAQQSAETLPADVPPPASPAKPASPAAEGTPIDDILLPKKGAQQSAETVPADEASPTSPATPASPTTEGTPIEDILNPNRTPSLDGQDIDSNQRLLDALSRSSQVGPVFRVSPDRVFLQFDEGGQASEQVRITNLGDTTGAIRGIAALGAIEGLLVTHGCGPTLEPAAFCDIAVSFASETPREVLTVLAINVEERDRSSIEIPLSIVVNPAPLPVNPTPEPTLPPEPTPEPAPLDPNDPRLGGNQEPRGLTPEEIARAYFGAVGGLGASSPGPISVVALPESMRAVEEKLFLGGIQPTVERISQDPRYDEDVASTEASLPVDRSKIITSDRVIKAILDTPFSNVLCGKVVAVVESDVYSATSNVPLIQAGSRVVGRCGEMVQERAGIVWERILTVDGRSVSLTGENSMTRDASGLGGALGRVYRTPFDRYILPIFGTGVDVAAGAVQAAYGEDESQTVTETGQVVQNTSALNEGIRTATEAVQGTAQSIIQDMRDVREVLVVPAGTRIDIEIFEDIYFKDEREIVRIADTVYDVPRALPVEAPIGAAAAISLAPYQPGLEGPVVVVNGRRFVVQESQGAPSAVPGGPSAGGGAAPTQPTAPGAGGRPSANTPTAPATRDTLEDLNAPAPRANAPTPQG